MIESHEICNRSAPSELAIARTEALLTMPRVAQWDGVYVGNPENWMVIHNDATIADWPHRINYSHFSPEFAELVSIREITREQARKLGATRFFPGRLVEYAAAEVLDGVIGAVTRAPCAIHGNTVRPLRKDVVLKAVEDGFSESIVARLVSALLTRRYDWTVRLRTETGCLAATVATTPAGAAATFRLRDVEPGKKRRAALRNWISEHWRLKSSEDTSHLVRAHLRGETKFNWQGLECELVPSQFDREKEIARKAE